MEAIKLIKFGSQRNMEDLYLNGIVFMNTVQYFRNYKDEILKGDDKEGISYILRNASAEIFHQGTRILHGDKANFFFRNEEDIGNIYCLTALWKDHLNALVKNEFEVDLKLRSMGESCVVIHNPKLFMSKVTEELNKLELKFRMHAIEYLDFNSTVGEYGIFSKPTEFSYQMEVRVFVKSEGLEPLKVSLGSLQDIATIHPTKELVLDKTDNKMADIIDYEPKVAHEP